MCNIFIIQARDVRTNEVVAIKKMSYSGKQSTEVCWLSLTYIMLQHVDSLICCVSCYSTQICFTPFTEMARHNQGGEIPAKNTTPKQHRVQRMLPARAHCLGKRMMILYE